MHRSGGANNLLEKQVNSLILPKDIGTKSLKSGSASTGRDLNTLVDLYSNTCSECLKPFSALPNHGLHHDCKSLIYGIPKPPKEPDSNIYTFPLLY